MPVTWPVNALLQAGQQFVGIDLVEQRAADPVVLDHVVIERVGDPCRIGDRLQIGPRTVELLCVGASSACVVSAGPQYPSSLGGNA